jgi:hypothetical protein
MIAGLGSVELAGACKLSMPNGQNPKALAAPKAYSAL